jgi:hypothetical protein
VTTTPEQEYREADTGETPTTLAPVSVVVAEPVRVITRQSRTWTAQQVTTDNATPVRVAPRHPGRTSLILSNVGATVAFIAPDRSSCTPTSGFPVAVNGALTLETQDEVWMIAGTLAILAQHMDG